MAIPDCETPADFKARLYEGYSSQHVLVSAGTVQIVLDCRAPYLKRMIASCLPADKSIRILDLGCGYGGILYALRQAGYTRVTGVDVSAEQLDLARHLGFEDLHCKDIHSFLDDIPNGAYDAVIAFDILEHFNGPELFSLMGKLHRVLAPGSRFIVHVPNGQGLFFGAILYGDLTHERAFTRASMNQLAAATSFRVVAVKEDAPVVHGATSLLRRLIWCVGSSFARLLLAAETGGGLRDTPLTQNFLAVLDRE
jgi:SAM-dependent methyltransferase